MNKINKNMIAPCGMNCSLCLGFQRKENHCDGCRNKIDIKYATKGRKSCIIKHCIIINSNKSGFCYECEKFPCKRLKDLDKRYTTKYHMSMLENLKNIKINGINTFLKDELKKWTCKNCNNLICIHRDFCLNCKSIYRSKNENIIKKF